MRPFKTLLVGLCLTAPMILVALPKQVVNDDRDVLQAVMLGFFKKESWHSADWEPKKMVILRSNYAGKVRPDFTTEAKNLQQSLAGSISRLEEYIADLDKKKVDQRASASEELVIFRQNLQALNLALSLPRGNSYTPPNLVPIKQLNLDRRIVVTDESRRGFFRERTNPNLEKWTVEATLTRPAYSSDGNLALVKLSVPWSMHSADVWLVFERSLGTWKRLAYHAIFYV